MPDKIILPDQEDILTANQRLTADHQRLTAELIAATDLLETAQEQTAAAVKRADDLAARLSPLETAAKVAGEELTRVQAENAQLTARMADFNAAVAAEVQKLGLRPKAAAHKEAPATPDLTPTQRVLAAKGVGSLADLRPQS